VIVKEPKKFVNYYNTMSWQNLKNAALNRDKGTCIICGHHIEDSPDIIMDGHHRFYYHHRDEFAGMEYPLESIATLCRPCHDKVTAYHKGNGENLYRNSWEEVKLGNEHWAAKMRERFFPGEATKWAANHIKSRQLTLEEQTIESAAPESPKFRRGSNQQIIYNYIKEYSAEGAWPYEAEIKEAVWDRLRPGGKSKAKYFRGVLRQLVRNYGVECKTTDDGTEYYYVPKDKPIGIKGGPDPIRIPAKRRDLASIFVGAAAVSIIVASVAVAYAAINYF